MNVKSLPLFFHVTTHRKIWRKLELVHKIKDTYFLKTNQSSSRSTSKSTITVKSKLKRKENELKLDFLQHINEKLSEAKFKNNSSAPQKMIQNIAQSSAINEQ